MDHSQPLSPSSTPPISPISQPGIATAPATPHSTIHTPHSLLLTPHSSLLPAPGQTNPLPHSLPELSQFDTALWSGLVWSLPREPHYSLASHSSLPLLTPHSSLYSTRLDPCPSSLPHPPLPASTSLVSVTPPGPLQSAGSCALAQALRHCRTHLPAYCTTLHSMALQYSAVVCTAVQCTPLQCTVLCR